MGIQILHNVEAGKIKFAKPANAGAKRVWPLRDTRRIRGRRLRQGGVRAI